MSSVDAIVAEPDWKVVPFVPQISSSCEEPEAFMGRQISGSTACSSEAALEQRVWARAMDSQWKLRRSDLKMKKELSRTLKSTLYQASWQGVEVVVKCAGLHDDNVSSKIQYLDAEKSVKKVPSNMEDKEITEELLHEIDLLSSLRHPDLVMFLGACIDRHLSIMCVTEFLPGGDLERYFKAQREKHDVCVWKPGMRQVLDWSLAIGRALQFLHGRGVVHRDLKPLNLLLTKHLEIKVGDFGISRLMAKCEGYSMTGGVGSWRYMAPEVVRYQPYDEKVDIYAYGLIMYFMSSGKTPFHQLGHNPEVILAQYRQGKEPRPLAPDCPSKIRPILAASWHEQPARRPSAEDVLENLEMLAAQSQKSCGPCALM